MIQDTTDQARGYLLAQAGALNGTSEALHHNLSVTQVSTSDARGGAALAALRLHGALPQAGIRSQMFVAQRFGNDEAVLEYNPLAPAPRSFGRFFFRLSRRFHRPSVESVGSYLSPDRVPAGWRLLSQLPPSDVVNLHWVTDMLDYGTLPALASRVPVVWTFHDMNAFTGGCHYSGPCERFVDHCGACPQLKTSPGENDLTRNVFERKRRVFEQIDPSRLTVVSPSAWLAKETMRSGLFKRFNVRVIPNGINLKEYYPMGRSEARKRLNLPQDAKIVLFVADLIEDERKGFGLLLKAVEAIRDIPGLLLVTMGRGDTSRLTDPVFRHFGSLHGSEKLRTAYSAADVFAIPSMQDNLPNTILESMACGTPVVGFASGGIVEAVEHGRTGLLASTGDANALVPHFRRLLGDNTLLETFSQEARARVEREYTLKLQAMRYASLYAEITKTLHRSRS
ncbi:MAG TPA: glycosyltransferase family 4 protein [Opitutaceae bacterium]|nr:glycosyltransferase family 4 protein [Opitutaceae bacterium]